MEYGMGDKVGDIHRMESKHVNWPHMVYIINCLFVALECIFLVLDLWTWTKYSTLIQPSTELIA